MQDKISYYVVNNFESAFLSIAKKHKYTKVLLLSTREQDCLKFKAILSKNQVFPIEIVLSEFIDFSVDNIKPLTSVNEDVRAVVSMSCGLIDCAKYLASILNVPCYACMQGVYVDAFLPFNYIKNGFRFDKIEFSCEFIAVVENKKEHINHTFLSLIKCAISLVDKLCFSALTNLPIEKQQLYSIKSGVIDGLYQYEDGQNQALIDSVISLSKLIYHDKMALPSYNALKLLMGKDYSINCEFLHCKGIIESIATLLTTNKKPKMIDYSIKATEVSLALNANRLYVLNALLEQVRSIKSFDISQILIETSLIQKLLFRLVDLYENGSPKTEQLTLLESRAISLLGDTPFGINAMTAVRELC